MKINLEQIYKELEAWRDERKITAESQKTGYLVNVMEELGELSQALRDYDKYTNYFKDCVEPFGYEGKGTNYDIKQAEYAIIDALCNISVLTINAGMELPCEVKPLIIVLKDEFSVADIFVAIADFIRTDANGSPFNYYDFARILKDCAGVCEQYGFNYEIAMLETIKQFSSNTGKEYKAKADYEKAKIKDTKQELNDMKQTMKRQR